MDAALVAVLERARNLGFLGPGPVEAHVQHAEAFAVAVPTAPAQALDLGSGAGVPGLVLALRWPASRWMLLDAGLRRTEFLGEAARELRIDARVTILRARAEEAGHRGDLRSGFDLVVARSFGPPAATAECGAPFLHVGGRLLVSEPPEESDDRWSTAGLERLGLVQEGLVRADASTVRVFVQVSACPAGFPRRTGVPARRPLF